MHTIFVTYTRDEGLSRAEPVLNHSQNRGPSRPVHPKLECLSLDLASLAYLGEQRHLKRARSVVTYVS